MPIEKRPALSPFKKKMNGPTLSLYQYAREHLIDMKERETS